jgi:hypothetical protein
VEDPDRRTASIKGGTWLHKNRDCKSGLERSDILSNNIGGEARTAEPPASGRNMVHKIDIAKAAWSEATY